MIALISKIMATKSEKTRQEALIEQSARKPRTQTPRRGRTSAGPRKPHNLGERAGRHARVAFEGTASGRPSRKSTRDSEHRQRAASQLERTQQLVQSKPETRARRAQGQALKVGGKP
jgi:hypothetical protein